MFIKDSLFPSIITLGLCLCNSKILLLIVPFKNKSPWAFAEGLLNRSSFCWSTVRIQTVHIGTVPNEYVFAG